MPDQSHLDDQYFIDRYKYNCPFCNRRHVSYKVVTKVSFNWTDTKICYAYIVTCDSCSKDSLHLSFENIPVELIYAKFSMFGKDVTDIDAKFFYSVPTSFFVLDSNIPKVLRELFTESEQCLKSNLLTGASACVRKMIYELAKLEKAPGDNYEDRIKALKSMKKEVDPSYFDILFAIQQTTSDKVHENAYDKWEAKHLRLLLATVHEILREIYVTPKLRQLRQSKVLDLKKEILGDKETRNQDDSRS